MKIIVGLTGASGSVFALELLKKLREVEGEKYVIASRWGKSVLAQETGLTLEDLAPYARKVFSNDDLSSPLASGSNVFDAMVIVPCSASTLSKVSVGLADSLITRAAQVVLKEQRKLVLCLRETPLSLIHFRQMVQVAEAGATVMPISPAFYQNTTTVQEQAQDFAGRVMQLLNVSTPTAGWKQEAL